ncbi:UNVERIFIED_CONTAM: hypothetical protein QE602_11840, partial [Streptococcus suis]
LGNGHGRGHHGFGVTGRNASPDKALGGAACARRPMIEGRPLLESTPFASQLENTEYGFDDQ